MIIMLPETEQIKSIRKNLGMTQKELAVAIGVSQSIIAKIESKNVSPSYEIIKKVFDFFEKMEKRDQKKASDVMNKKIVFVKKGDKISKAIELMKIHGYSQLPVSDNDHSIGSISEATIVEQISSGKSLDDVMKKRIDDVMEESFPAVNEDTPISSITALLQHSSAVIVNKKGKISGIITKSDLLKMK
jgi:predicted transcriptional regulator